MAYTNNQELISTCPTLFQLKLLDFIAYETQTNAELQELFSLWSDLEWKQRILVNYIACHMLSGEYFIYYSIVVAALNYLDNMQETEGACGFSEDLVKNLDLPVEIGNKIHWTISNTGKLLLQFTLQLELNKEIIKNGTAIFLKFKTIGESGDHL